MIEQSGLVVSVQGDIDPALPDLCSGLNGVLEVQQHGEHVHLTVDEPHVAIPALIEQLQHSAYQLDSLTTRHASLEDVFVKVAGRTLEEAEEERPS